jgi:hypothetical protein
MSGKCRMQILRICSRETVGASIARPQNKRLLIVNGRSTIKIIFQNIPIKNSKTYLQNEKDVV